MSPRESARFPVLRALSEALGFTTKGSLRRIETGEVFVTIDAQAALENGLVQHRRYWHEVDHAGPGALNSIDALDFYAVPDWVGIDYRGETLRTPTVDLLVPRDHDIWVTAVGVNVTTSSALAVALLLSRFSGSTGTTNATQPLWWADNPFYITATGGISPLLPSSTSGAVGNSTLIPFPWFFAARDDAIGQLRLKTVADDAIEFALGIDVISAPPGILPRHLAH